MTRACRGPISHTSQGDSTCHEDLLGPALLRARQALGGTPAGTASITYDPAAQTLTVVVNATGVTPGMHAAHIHFGSCQSQGGVAYMLMDFTANSKGQIVNETRTLPSVTTPIPPSGWYLNLHQGNSNNILKNGAPTILFRPLLCASV